jgi:translation initiation factor 1
MRNEQMNNSRPVYSTDRGRLCPDCGRPADECRCCRKKKQDPGLGSAFAADGAVRVQRETKGRKGKAVTAVYGIPLEEEDLLRFAKVLKQRCGAGGSVKNGAILIQGDHRETLVREMERNGYPVRVSGR